MKILSIFLAATVLLLSGHAYAQTDAYDRIYAASEVTDEGIRLISYDQFMEIRNSGEKYLLFDVLLRQSYNKGHIEGAVSFPLPSINKETTAKKIGKDTNIIVYCGSFKCTASTAAAKKLDELGYKVVDYKGGLKEWKEKGNKLVR